MVVVMGLVLLVVEAVHKILVMIIKLLEDGVVMPVVAVPLVEEVEEVQDLSYLLVLQLVRRLLLLPVVVEEVEDRVIILAILQLRIMCLGV